jgi:DNA polymerase elongation subunit (family B)
LSAVVNAYVEADDEHILLLHRNEETGELRRHRVVAEHAIYFRRTDVSQQLLQAWRRDHLCRGYRPEGEWLRTRWRGWDARRMVLSEMHERGVPTYEGDCSPVKRWMADHPDVGIQKPRRVYLDIETDSRVSLGEARERGSRILVWSLVNEAGDWQAGVLEEDSDPAERVLLQQLYAALEPYDQICAWGGDDFDFPIIGKRTQARRIAGGIPRRWLRMDHLALYRRLNLQVAESGEEKQSFALNAVALAQLGEGKDVFDSRRTYDSWFAGGDELERLVRYCVRDADLMRRIEERTGYIKQNQTIAEICGIFPDTFALLPTSQMDGILLRIGHRRAIHFPSTVKRETLNAYETPYKGSYNKDPPEKAGILRDVHVVDFSSFYPSVMVSWNMSWETRVAGPVNGPLPPNVARSPKTGICFRTDVLGVVPDAITSLLAERKKWSATRAALVPGTPEAHDAERWTNGYKVVPNSFYGAQGNPACRFHDRRVAESVSQTCAWLAEKTEWSLRERYPELRVIYVDTDGLWLMGVTGEQVKEAVAWLNSEVYPRLLKEAGCVTNIVKLEYEKSFERVIFVAAKNYVGRFLMYKGTSATNRSKPEIKGVAYKRGDKSKFTRDFQAEIIDLLVGGMGVSKTPGPTEDLALYDEAVARWRRKILEEPLAVEDIQITKGLAKCVCSDLSHRGKAEHYAAGRSTKGNVVASPPHVRVARILKARGEYIVEGTKISYVVTDARAKPQGVIPAKDYTGECDRRHLWDVTVWEPTRALLVSAFPEHPWKQYDAPVPKKEKAPVVEVPVKPARVRKAKPSVSEDLFG